MTNNDDYVQARIKCGLKQEKKHANQFDQVIMRRVSWVGQIA